MLVKISNPAIPNGVYIEIIGGDYTPASRCFRFDENGNAEYARLADLTSGNPAPRWYGFHRRADQFTFA